MEDFPVSPVFENLQDMGSVFPGRFYMCVPQDLSPWAHVPQQEKLLQWESYTMQLDKAGTQQWKPNTTKNKM